MGEEIFQIYRFSIGEILTCTKRDLADEVIDGIFYEQKLTEVKKT